MTDECVTGKINELWQVVGNDRRTLRQLRVDVNNNDACCQTQQEEIDNINNAFQSGLWTPQFTNVSNVVSVVNTVGQHRFQRINDIVYISGAFQVTTMANYIAGAVIGWEMSLPIPTLMGAGAPAQGRLTGAFIIQSVSVPPLVTPATMDTMLMEGNSALGTNAVFAMTSNVGNPLQEPFNVRYSGSYQILPYP